MKFTYQLATLILLLFGAQHVNAAPISLIDWGFNVDGSTVLAADGDDLPTNSLVGAFGDISIEVSGAGDHFIYGFFDIEIDRANNTFFNEEGATVGSPQAGLSWEIDEPGYIFGDIYDNLLAGFFDGTNALAGLLEDVSVGLGWDFTLTASQSAIATFSISDIAPTSGFYLQHSDNEIGPNFDSVDVFFSSSLQILNNSPTPPTDANAPSGILLLLGILAFARFYRKWSLSV